MKITKLILFSGIMQTIIQVYQHDFNTECFLANYNNNYNDNDSININNTDRNTNDFDDTHY